MCLRHSQLESPEMIKEAVGESNTQPSNMKIIAQNILTLVATEWSGRVDSSKNSTRKINAWLEAYNTSITRHAI